MSNWNRIRSQTIHFSLALLCLKTGNRKNETGTDTIFLKMPHFAWKPALFLEKWWNRTKVLFNDKYVKWFITQQWRCNWHEITNRISLATYLLTLYRYHRIDLMSNDENKKRILRDTSQCTLFIFSFPHFPAEPKNDYRKDDNYNCWSYRKNQQGGKMVWFFGTRKITHVWPLWTHRHG